MCFDTGTKLTMYYGSIIAKCAIFLIQSHSMLYSCSEGAFCAVRLHDMNAY